MEEEENEGQTKEIPVAAHARRASMTNAGRFSQPPQATPLPDTHQERGQSLMRRLSLSSNAFVKPEGRARSPPNVPPNTAVSPTSDSLPFSRGNRDNKARRATMAGAENGKPRRAPSPMGERILKGHFDGFN